MKIIHVLFLQLFVFTNTFASVIECIGSKDSKTVAVYLHGMDSESPSSQELKNRSSLIAISNSLGIGFAIPRAKNKCPNQKMICWGWNFNDSKTVKSALTIAKKAQSACFPKANNLGLVGFSNGGFIANQIVKDCLKTDFKWLISIGAGGSWESGETKDLSQCGQLVMMAGKKDLYNYKRIQELGKWFQAQKAQVTLVEYDDGHTVPEKDLLNVLRALNSR